MVQSILHTNSQNKNIQEYRKENLMLYSFSFYKEKYRIKIIFGYNKYKENDNK